MNEMFSQGGKGSTGILTNKQAIARKFGVKQNEVVYFSVGVDLGGYKVIYDKSTQRAYSLPADIGSGVTAVSLNSAGVLVHSAGNVDLGALAVTREEYVTLPSSFDSGFTIVAGAAGSKHLTRTMLTLLLLPGMVTPPVLSNDRE